MTSELNLAESNVTIFYKHYNYVLSSLHAARALSQSQLKANILVTCKV